MAIRIKARAGEPVGVMLRRFKKLCEKEGLTKEVKRRAYYEKPSERKQRALRKRVKRVTGPTPRGGARREAPAHPQRGRQPDLRRAARGAAQQHQVERHAGR